MSPEDLATTRAYLDGDLTRGEFIDHFGWDPLPLKEGDAEPRTYKRRNGIDKLPSGRWRVRYFDKTSGRALSKSFVSHESAVVFRDDQRVAVRNGTHVAPNAGNATLREHVQQWLAEHDASQSTVDAHETRLRVHVLNAFGDERLSDITEDAVRRWHKRDLTSLAPSTRRAVLTSFSAVMASAVRARLIMSNPAGPEVIKRRRAPARKFKPLEAQQVGAIRDALPERYAVIATLGAGLGLRQGEVFGLSPDDFDVDTGLVTVNRQVKILAGGSRLVFDYPKGGEDHPIRQVPLPDSVWAAVEDHLRDFPAQPIALPWASATAKPVTIRLLVTSRESKPLNKNYVNGGVWKPALRAAGLPDTRENGMHALRHFYASTLLDSGETIRAVAEYLGHADPGFTLRVYSHVMERSHERTQGAIDAALASAKPGSVVTQMSQRRSQSA